MPLLVEETLTQLLDILSLLQLGQCSSGWRLAIQAGSKSNGTVSLWVSRWQEAQQSDTHGRTFRPHDQMFLMARALMCQLADCRKARSVTLGLAAGTVPDSEWACHACLLCASLRRERVLKARRKLTIGVGLRCRVTASGTREKIQSTDKHLYSASLSDFWACVMALACWAEPDELIIMLSQPGIAAGPLFAAVSACLCQLSTNCGETHNRRDPLPHYISGAATRSALHRAVASAVRQFGSVLRLTARKWAMGQLYAFRGRSVLQTWSVELSDIAASIHAMIQPPRSGNPVGCAQYSSSSQVAALTATAFEPPNREGQQLLDTQAHPSFAFNQWPALLGPLSQWAHQRTPVGTPEPRVDIEL